MPCPVCGGAIHPIAGKCKHCKADLVRLRGRVAPAPPAVLAAAFAPRLDGTPPPFAPAGPGVVPAPAAVARPHPLIGSGPPQAPAAAAALPTLHELPPLPVTRTRWPLVVALLAGVAIVVCVVLLLGDNNSSAAGGVKKRAAPAPDRMDTSPAPPAARPPLSRDPFSGPQGAAPDLPPDPRPPPGADPFQLPPPLTAPSGGAAPSPDEFYGAAFAAGCRRLAQCPGFEDLEQLCALTSLLPAGDDYAAKIRGGQCTYDEHAAQRCLSDLASMPCLSSQSIDFDLDKLQDLFGSFSSKLDNCTTALRCN